MILREGVAICMIAGVLLNNCFEILENQMMSRRTGGSHIHDNKSGLQNQI